MGHVSVESLQESHRAHRESLDHIVARLEARGIPFDLEFRGDVTVQMVAACDLLITVGGDGTVLDLSHRAFTTPILAINSDPGSSVGYFTAGDATEFDELLDRVIPDGWEPLRLRRFHIRLDGQQLGPPVLNDILICHENPAAVSAYSLKVGNHPAEPQKSSGIWVSTPAGSTAAVRSAGGFVLPFRSGNIQYVVREPYPPPAGGYRFLKGIHPFEEHFEVISRMREGQVFIDGPHLSFPMPLGSTLTLDPEAPALQLFGVQEDRRTA